MKEGKYDTRDKNLPTALANASSSKTSFYTDLYAFGFVASFFSQNNEKSGFFQNQSAKLQ